MKRLTMIIFIIYLLSIYDIILEVRMSPGVSRHEPAEFIFIHSAYIMCSCPVFVMNIPLLLEHASGPRPDSEEMTSSTFIATRVAGHASVTCGPVEVTSDPCSPSAAPRPLNRLPLTPQL